MGIASTTCPGCGLLQAGGSRRCKRCGLAFGPGPEPAEGAGVAVAPAGPGADPRGGRGKLSRFGQIIREHRVAQAAKARAAEEAAARARGVTRVVSEELTAALDPGDAVLVEFSCRKCPGFQVLRVDEEDLDFGVEAECGRCGRVKPVTRAELAERRLAVDEP